MGANTLVSGLRGPTTIEFNDGGSKIIFNAPDFKLGGTVMGDRTVECTSSLIFCDIQNNLKSVVIMNTYRTEGMISKKVFGSKVGVEGIIYECPNCAKAVPKFGAKQELPEKLKDVKEAKKIISKIDGSWLSQLDFDGKTYWDINECVPSRQTPLINNSPETEIMGQVLPSDWRYREDLIWLKYGFMEIAANWKLKLEIQQRKDRKNRQERLEKEKK